MSLVLSERQKRFCEYYVREGLNKARAAEKAGYSCKDSSAYSYRGGKLLENPLIDQYVKELREEKFDKETIFRTVIEKYYSVLSLRIGDYTHSVEETMDSGKKYNRLWVKPYDEWDEIAKLLLEDWAKDGHPVFMSKANALRELSRIFGLYSDTLVNSIQDISKVLESAGLSTGLTKDELESIGEIDLEEDYEDDEDELTDVDEDELVNFTNDGVVIVSADSEQSYQFDEDDTDADDNTDVDDEYVDDYSI